LYFQTLDNKGECLGYYANNELYYQDLPENADKTWYYSPSLKDRHVEYARIYSGGVTLAAACPEEFKPTWDKITNRLRAFLKSFQASKVNLDETCIYNLIPEFFLYELCAAKNKITEHVLNNNPRPLNHDFMVDVIKMLSEIKEQPLNIDIEPIMTKLVTVRGKNFVNKLREVNWICDYNPFGTVTGRLTTMPKTFPILTLHRDFRGCLHPQNDWFLELDYNAAEVRTLLGLSGTPQPEGDIHEWNIKNIYDGKLDRPSAKQKIFEWLYSHRKNKKAEAFYDKNLVKEKYWNGYNIHTELGRDIKGVDNHHALNYIIQSTTSDLVLSKAVEIHNHLRDKESNVAFMMHDSIVIDLKHEERHTIPDLMKIFSTTPFGDYKVNTALGKNFGDMKGLNINGS
tara:strand:+ start:8152 stop:9348 length:1197 start_codon:yes stop_codon:yes gene_type:complete